MVWDCINNEQVGELAIIDGILTAEKYRNIFQQYLFPSIGKLGESRTYTFQHDYDPKHTAKIVNKFLRETNISLLSW